MTTKIKVTMGERTRAFTETEFHKPMRASNLVAVDKISMARASALVKIDRMAARSDAASLIGSPSFAGETAGLQNPRPACRAE